MRRTRPPQLPIDRLKVDSVTRRVYGEIVLGSSVGRSRPRYWMTSTNSTTFPRDRNVMSAHICEK